MQTNNNEILNEVIIEREQMSPLYRVAEGGLNDILQSLYRATDRYEAIDEKGRLDQGWSLCQPGDIADLLNLFLDDVNNIAESIELDTYQFQEGSKEYLLSLCADFKEVANHFIDEANTIRKETTFEKEDVNQLELDLT